MEKEGQVVWVVVSLVVATALMLPLLHRLRLSSRRGLRLPPGSMGLFFFGESLSLKCQRMNFYTSREKRYGKVFKTHLFGHPSIVITSPDAAQFVLLEQPARFKQRGLPIIEKLVGDLFFGYQTQRKHARLRKFMHGPLLPETLENSISDIEALATSMLHSWELKTINILEEAKHYALKVAMEYVVGAAPHYEKEELTKACEHLIRGVSSIPVNIPGTHYHKALKDSKKKACALLENIVSWRQLEKRPHGDILGILMDTQDEDGCKLTPNEIHDNVLTLLYLGHDTAAAALTWAVKYLTDNPKLLEDVTAEHETIRQKKTSQDETLMWSDIKDQMPLSIRVIKETLRIANIVEFCYREVVEDVEYKGYLFPKGWRILVAHSAVHSNSEYYTNPGEFNSSRFKIAPKPYTYTPFGNGAHVCLGRELANLELLIFLHHFTLNYRWESIGDTDGSEYAPIHVPKGGFPIAVRRRSMTDGKGS
ncbi:hypothetical protein O6H91_06G114900 [Diphasiastrum complanatum]|uniref:Uncharacterized protein n=1 Tax=Diphasiastrum complanatum TaxID=34168 RepID=A0ACC2DIM3_DIPCM|nr:hypothetical protein O6H91_06G114900 [Diphasiastrum complanatum]